MKKAIMAVCLSGMLAACGGGSSSGGGSVHHSVVNYSVDPAKGPQCYGTDDINTFKGSTLTSVDCIWDCATYKNQTNVYVDLTFERRNTAGAAWSKSYEYISGGICF